MADEKYFEKDLGQKGIDGARLIAAIVNRGMPLRSLKHIHNTLRGTVWHYVASGLTGCTNGSGGDALNSALQNVRVIGYADAEATKRAIISLVMKQDDLVDEWLRYDSVVQNRKKVKTGRFDRLSEIDDVEWLWPGWIPRGYLSLIASEPGLGKTSMAIWLATKLLAGGKLPDGTDVVCEGCKDPDGHPEDCGCPAFLWLDTESGDQLLKKRIREFGTPGRQIVHFLDDEDYATFDLGKAKWQDKVEAAAIEKKVQCVFTDTLRGAHSGKESDEEMMPVLKWCADLCRDLNSGWVNTHHLRKHRLGETREATMDGVRGSTVIAAMHRVIIALDKPDPMIDHKRMRVIKSNLDVMPEAVGFGLTSSGVFVTDAPGLPETTASSATATAVSFLQTYLTEPKHAAEVKNDANLAGIGTATLNRAKMIVGVTSERRAGVWWWALPWNAPDAKEPEEGEK